MKEKFEKKTKELSSIQQKLIDAAEEEKSVAETKLRRSIDGRTSRLTENGFSDSELSPRGLIFSVPYPLFLFHMQIEFLLYPSKRYVFPGILESACLSVRLFIPPCVRVSVCVQYSSNFLSGTPTVFLYCIESYWYIDHILKLCKTVINHLLPMDQGLSLLEHIIFFVKLPVSVRALAGLLSLSQMTNFGLFQSKRVCKQQF